MARRFSRKKGKSGSTPPLKEAKPTWVRYGAKEIEMLIVKLVKEGKTAAQVGIVLRDTYGIPSVKSVVGKNISEIIEAKKLKPRLPDDLTSLARRALAIRKHLEENHKDMTAKRGLQLTEAKILRLVRYYKRTEKLPLEWKYDPKTIKIWVE